MKKLVILLTTISIYIVITFGLLIAYGKDETQKNILSFNLPNSNDVKTINIGLPIVLFNIFNMLSFLVIIKLLIYMINYNLNLKDITPYWLAFWGGLQGATYLCGYSAFIYNCQAIGSTCYHIVTPLYVMLIIYTHITLPLMPVYAFVLIYGILMILWDLLCCLKLCKSNSSTMTQVANIGNVQTVILNQEKSGEQNIV